MEARRTRTGPRRLQGHYERIHRLMLEIAFALAFGFWFICTVLRQLPCRAGAAVAQYDVASLVPIWTFFAPTPIRSDLQIYFRDYGIEASPSRWRRLRIVYRKRFMHCLWNPDKRTCKGLYDLVYHVLALRIRLAERPETIRLSVPYLALANVVLAQPRPSDAMAREFMICEGRGYLSDRPRSVLFRSDRHAFHSIASRPQRVATR